RAHFFHEPCATLSFPGRDPRSRDAWSLSLERGRVERQGPPEGPETTHIETSATSMTTYLVTGANRGLGLEFARQLSARGDEVVATARDPKNARELSGLGVRVEP